MKKKIIILLSVLLLLPLVLILVSNFAIEVNAENKTYNDPNLIKKNKVGLLLGTSKYVKTGQINLYFKYRIDAAVELYEKGKIDFILVSGDNATIYYNEPITFKKALMARGIPEDQIFLDYAGFRTLDSVVRAKKIFGQESITIISQEFHNERAIYLADKKGIHAIGFNARDVSIRAGFKTQVREYFARTKAFLDILFGVEPKFLGDKIEIGC